MKQIVNTRVRYKTEVNLYTRNHSKKLYSNQFKMKALLVLAGIFVSVHSHGHMIDPCARTSIQHCPFDTQQPYWWDNQGVWCGNVQQDLAVSDCGRCGDPAGGTSANQNGEFDKKVIVKTYNAGTVVEVTANFQAPHYGSFQIELCPFEQETDNCFQTLEILGGSEQVKENRMCVPYDNSNVDITARVRLPPGIRCSRCTLRWTYRTSYPGRPDWDNCLNPHPTQTFRNCADVSIV